MSHIVAIVGRPNVGKSTLFNRLCGERKAIVDELSGVTRDRHYGKSDWNGKEFSIIDTGGYISNSADIFEEEIRKQVILAIEEADRILFVVDVMSGITDLDEVIAGLLRKSRKKCLVVVNKVDNTQRYYDANVFYGLGLGDIYPVSAINGSGTGELLDALVADYSMPADEGEEDETPRFTIAGRPNVGKSSLANALLGEERNIVTPVAGTTRDSIHTHYKKFGNEFFLIDTAGLRKKGKLMENVEFYSIMRSVRAIEDADVCLLMIDATRGIEGQDVNIFNLIVRNKKGVLILVNKWDLVEKDTGSVKEFTAMIRERISPFEDVPVIFTSAITKQRIHKALETAVEVYKRRKQKIPTSRLNEVLREAVDQFHPPAIKGKYIKI
ncbi:MAG: ribosome biogenesis GTPase Der, partial [Bacteroidales bacterium]